MSTNKYVHTNHSLFNLGYHLILVTKYRHNLLDHFESDIKDLIMIASCKANIIIKNIEIMSDHIHIFFKCRSANCNIPKIVQYLKGFASYSIRKNIENFKNINIFGVPVISLKVSVIYRKKLYVNILIIKK